MDNVLRTIKTYVKDGLTINFMSYSDFDILMNSDKYFRGNIDIQKSLDYSQSVISRLYYIIPKMLTFFRNIFPNKKINNYIKTINLAIVIPSKDKLILNRWDYNMVTRTLRCTIGHENEVYCLISLFFDILMVLNNSDYRLFKKEYKNTLNQADISKILVISNTFYSHYLFANQLLGYGRLEIIKKDINLFKRIEAYYKSSQNKSPYILMKLLADNYSYINEMIDKYLFK